jgi:hypothetical protein
VFHNASMTWQEMFWNNYCFSYKPVNSMRDSWMSQTWRAWHSSWYMSVTFMGGSIKEDILFRKPLETRTTWEDTFKVLDSFVTCNGLWRSRCDGVCTDGAKTMTGSHRGVVMRVQAVAPDTTWVHYCSIHRDGLAVKGMPDSLKDVLDTTLKMVNFVKARPLNSHVFLHYAMIWAATM